MGSWQCAIEQRPANLVSGMPGFVEHAASQHVKYCHVNSMLSETVAVSNYSFNVCVYICGWVGGWWWVGGCRACVCACVYTAPLSPSHTLATAHTDTGADIDFTIGSR